MKTYQVFYWIKKNKKEYLNHIFFLLLQKIKKRLAKLQKIKFLKKQEEMHLERQQSHILKKNLMF